MTVREVVEQVKKGLGEINVPVVQMQSIGFPIARAIDGLNAVLQAWDEEDKQNQKQQEKPETKLEVVPEDEIPDGAQIIPIKTEEA